jgi:hypothetical protein
MLGMLFKGIDESNVYLNTNASPDLSGNQWNWQKKKKNFAA